MTQVNRKPLVDQIFGDNKAPVDDVLDADFADLLREAEEVAAEFNNLPDRISSDKDQIAVGTAIAKARAMEKKIDHIRATEGKPLFETKKKVDAYFKDMALIVSRVADTAQSAADKYARQKADQERERARREADEARRRAEAERAKADAAKSATAAGNAAGRAEALDAQADELEAKASGSAADLTRMRAGGVTSSTREVWEYRIDDETALFASLGPLGAFLSLPEVEKAIRSAVRVQKGRTSVPGVAVFLSAKASFLA